MYFGSSFHLNRSNLTLKIFELFRKAYLLHVACKREYAKSLYQLDKHMKRLPGNFRFQLDVYNYKRDWKVMSKSEQGSLKIED